MNMGVCFTVFFAACALAEAPYRLLTCIYLLINPNQAVMTPDRRPLFVADFI